MKFFRSISAYGAFCFAPLSRIGSTLRTSSVATNKDVTSSPKIPQQALVPLNSIVIYCQHKYSSSKQPLMRSNSHDQLAPNTRGSKHENAARLLLVRDSVSSSRFCPRLSFSQTLTPLQRSPRKARVLDDVAALRQRLTSASAATSQVPPHGHRGFGRGGASRMGNWSTTGQHGSVPSRPHGTKLGTAQAQPMGYRQAAGKRRNMAEGLITVELSASTHAPCLLSWMM